MSTVSKIAETIHDTVDASAITIEKIHRSIADLPLDMLETIEPFKDAVADVRDVQTSTIKSVYGFVRQVNDRIGEIATEVLA